MIELLDSEALAEITGYKRPRDQRKWLERENVPHKLDRRGRPRVSRGAMEAALSGEKPADGPRYGVIR